MSWGEVNDDLRWNGRYSPIEHMRLLPAGFIKSDLELVASALEVFVDDLPRDRRRRSRVVEDGLYLAVRFLVAERALTKPPARARMPILVLAGMFAARQLQYEAGATRRQFAISDVTRRMLSSWFWATLLSPEGIRGSALAIEAAAAELRAWLEASGGPPQSVKARATNRRGAFDEGTLGRGAFAYVLDALLLQRDPRDLFTGEPIIAALLFRSVVGEGMDRHHIFPYAWCERNRITIEARDSPINMMPVSERSNRGIGDAAPSEYLKFLRERDRTPDDRIDTLLRSQLIDPTALRRDDFDGFFSRRRAALMELVDTALAPPPAP